MEIRKLLFIFSIDILLIFGFTTCAVFGISSNGNKSAQSGDYLSYEVSNVNFDNYNYFFGLNSYGNTVITIYGKPPARDTEEQKDRWNSTLEELSSKTKATLASKYMYPHGEVVTCGANTKGYFVILFKYGNVDESLMNEIYAQIDNSAREMSIYDIPVEFGYGTYYRQKIPLSDGLREYEFGRSIENLSESDIQIIEEYMMQKHESVYKGGDIANYGTIPLLKDKNEHDAWVHKMMLIFHHIRGKLDSYMDKGQISSYAYGSTRLEVGIPQNLSYEEKTAIAKESYQVIDGEARKENVTDVPVAFKSVGNLYNATETDDLRPIEETNLSSSEDKSAVELNNSNNNTDTNNSESDNGSSSGENESSKNNATPGFGLLGSLACLYGGWKLRKK
ncbi:hypothetical protein EO98_09640 [Methanosarcina sp. 2.H.T.1A.6]|uniref:hypothetical protein n=1 Tax=unclassified Methanosarcina TaxID=2644672 RepID=UPI0006222B07|nr:MULTISPECIES: hypothetical protein [unclassified Methanosarcina]KKG14222.1 hypothetical protein EO94_16030 [Methanosarcina sp. 2.H.T.1A.3]KKG16048.1 hypothetical protein EO97_12575 [Methanosarcina sp. 2.H.T.1A.15]KKG19712.1 hypothetical protein EO98_09640 [Methanosarcina sp. 2.H.T.1A.6]KKG27099.1 hypothetical protein EO96_09050 [Methanosarcina sp. 2.H.T.1A.8]